MLFFYSRIQDGWFYLWLSQSLFYHNGVHFTGLYCRRTAAVFPSGVHFLCSRQRPTNKWVNFMAVGTAALPKDFANEPVRLAHDDVSSRCSPLACRRCAMLFQATSNRFLGIVFDLKVWFRPDRSHARSVVSPCSTGKDQTVRNHQKWCRRDCLVLGCITATDTKIDPVVEQMVQDLPAVCAVVKRLLRSSTCFWF